MKLGVIIFCSVRFLPIKTTKLKFCKIQKRNRNRLKPTGFGSIIFGLVWLFYIKNQKLYCFLGFFFYFLMGLVFVWFSFFYSVWFFDFRLMKPKPNRTEYFFKFPNRFFFHSSVFLVIFLLSQFN
jgi:hypothetical protein